MERLIHTNPIPSSTKQLHRPFLPRLHSFKPTTILSSKPNSKTHISVSCNRPFSPLASTFQESQNQLSVLPHGSPPKPHSIHQLAHTFFQQKKVIITIRFVCVFSNALSFQICCVCRNQNLLIVCARV